MNGDGLANHYITPLSTLQNIFADEERFELSTWCLTNTCSAIELFIQCWPAGIRTLNSRCKRPVLWSSWVTNHLCCGCRIRTNIWSLWDFWVNHYCQTALYCWPGAIRTHICLRLIKAGSPDPIELRTIHSATFRLELNTLILCLPLRSRGRWTCYPYTKPHYFYMVDSGVRTLFPTFTVWYFTS